MSLASSVIQAFERPRTVAVVLCRNEVTRRALRSAVVGERVEFCDHARRVIPRLRATGASLLIIEQSHLDDDCSFLVQAIREKAPAFAIAVLTNADKLHRDAVAITPFGVGDVVMIGAPNLAERLSALVNRHRVLERVADCGTALTAGLPPALEKVVRYPFTSEGLASQSVRAYRLRLGFSDEREFERCLQPVGTSPKRILAWRRLLFAVVLNERTLLTVDRIASEAGYSGANSYQRAAQDFAVMSRSALLASGGSAYLVRAFRSALGLQRFDREVSPRDRPIRSSCVG